MTATTPKFGLHYPTGTDKPCDGCTQINTLRDDIFAALDTISNTIALEQPGDLPMASIAYIGDPLIWPADNLRPLIFNSVEQDDIQAADLITRNSALLLGSSPAYYGTYMYGFTTTTDHGTTGSTISNEGWQIRLNPDTYTEPAFDDVDISTMEWVDTTQPPTFAQAALLVVTAPTLLTAMPGIGQLAAGGGFESIVIRFSRMWAIRLGAV